MTEAEHLRYPIGRFVFSPDTSPRQIDRWIGEIEKFPADFRQVADRLSSVRLDTSYRPGGWTRRQVIHHVADSHINSYIRFRWALTEDTPTIKAYDEKSWAELCDAKTAPIAPSLNLLENLHKRWTILLRSLSEDDLARKFIHPETGKQLSLKINIALYAWHGAHHLAHLRLG